MAFTTPGTAVAGEVLTAAFWNTNVRDNMNSVANGLLNFAVTNTQTSLSTTLADITGLSVTWTAEASHNYLVLGCVSGLIKQTNAGTFTLTITDSSNVVKNTFFQEFAVNETFARSWVFEWIRNAPAGTVTRKMRQVTSAAGGVFNRADVSDNVSYIAVLDLGNTAAQL